MLSRFPHRVRRYFLSVVVLIVDDLIIAWRTIAIKLKFGFETAPYQAKEPWRRHRMNNLLRPVSFFSPLNGLYATQVSKEEEAKNLTLTAEIKRLKESEDMHRNGSDKLNATNR